MDESKAEREAWSRQVRAAIRELTDEQRMMLAGMAELVHHAFFRTAMPAKWVCSLQHEFVDAFEYFTGIGSTRLTQSEMKAIRKSGWG